jgi:hypothetical protein
MSAFNILNIFDRCPVCWVAGNFDVQFKYGNTWQFHYKIGDKLKWGGNDVGVDTERTVRVEAITGPCENCGADFIECDVYITNNGIERVDLIGLERSYTTEEGYEIL